MGMSRIVCHSGGFKVITGTRRHCVPENKKELLFARIVGGIPVGHFPKEVRNVLL
jgi:hypothetical protein